MKNKILNNLSDTTIAKLTNVKVIVNDTYDLHLIWKEWHCYVTFPNKADSGYGLAYHDFGKNQPCWATLWIQDINGYSTLFVEACGAYQNYYKLEEVTHELCPNAIYFTNQTNFHNHPALRELTGEQNLHGMEKEIVEKQQELYRLRESYFRL